MAKRVVIQTPLYYNENVVNYVAIHTEDDLFSKLKLLEIVTKYEVVKFEVILVPTITVGAIGINRNQRKKYHMKKYKSYFVRSSSESIHHNRTFFDIINEQFDFKSRIGGMDSALQTIFGEVLLSRLYPQCFVAKTALTKTKGIVLHGPPGTGKTMIARIISDILKVKPKMVRGPEIFSSLVGESEKKVRDLFEDARNDQHRFGENSKLHVIIFDEIDVICKSRTHNDLVRNSVNDNVTAQLLSEIDGLVHLNNVFLIGTTNALENIDAALLRPGRLETTIKIEPPNLTARTEIFDIHTKALLRNGVLHQDVDIKKIVDRTAGMTGAHIERIVRLAVNAAMRRDILYRNKFDITEDEAECLEVLNQDFLEALSAIQI